jgi:predicted nucleic acid-binding protein
MRGTGRAAAVAEILRTSLAPGEQPATTRFNIAELYVGIERSESRAREERRVTSVIEGLDILEFDDRSARVFGRLSAALAGRGTPAGDMDVLIASIAIVSGHSLITRNPRHFTGMAGLSVLSY